MSSGVYNKFTGYHNRRSIRLPRYNYAQPGAYFVTICIHDRKRNLFGDVVDGKMVLNDAGKIANKCWMEIPEHFPHVKLDEYAVLPNHIHGIICLTNRRGTACRALMNDDGLDSGTACRAPTGMIEQFGKPTIDTIPTIIRSYKSAVSKQIHKSDKKFKWQRNYYERIIRNEMSLLFVRKYICENPVHWNIDSENHIAREIKELVMIEIEER
jgi:putative transposase